MRRDILETAKMLILSQQREKDGDQIGDLVSKISDMEAKLELLMKAVIKK